MPTLETTKQSCPYCGEPIELVVDTSMTGDSYIEDCQVCCQPMVVSVLSGGGGDVDEDGIGIGGGASGGEPWLDDKAGLQVTVRREDE